jgi:ThiF family
MRQPQQNRWKKLAQRSKNSIENPAAQIARFAPQVFWSLTMSAIPGSELSDDALLRYSRHILLPELGIEAQTAFVNAHALIIGAGGLGSPVALYLAAAGVGTITICDHDVVDLTNLQRQIAHDMRTLGQPKVSSVQQRIAEAKH